MQNTQDEEALLAGDENYFNDISHHQQQQQPEPTSSTNLPTGNGAAEADPNATFENQNAQATTSSSKAKRCAACTLCRKRKLKCDGAKPACSTCARLRHECCYGEVRKKSGPKRGYVKLLEARLAQVETLLKKDEPPAVTGLSSSSSRNDPLAASLTGNSGDGVIERDERPQQQQDFQQDFQPAAQISQPQSTSTPDFFTATTDGNAFSEETYPWELISLGLDEPLPIQPVVDELNQIYFEKFHPSLPMIHRPRFYAAMHLAPHTRPPICLRYAMWCNAAALTDKFSPLQEHFYHRARKYIQQDEMKGHGEAMLTIAHVQTWVLLATYEFKKMYFPRAWMSSGRASRMALMMGLNRLDMQGLQVKQCLPAVRDLTELEERKRSFWSAFCVDRYSSIGTGWPMAIEEGDIRTRLPGSEESFELSRPEVTGFLNDALEPEGAGGISSFGGVVLMACLFGRNLTHLHRPGEDDEDGDLNGGFWRRHRELDGVLLGISLALPDALRLPQGMGNSNVVFLNMNIHTSTICLHQAAIFKADTNKAQIPSRISAESKVRCITAAAETASIMRTISHLDLSAMNPFISFCLYVAARVFVQYLKSRPQDHSIGSSLRFLLSAMHAIKKKNPLTESFLVQLDVDLESAGLEGLRQKNNNRSTTSTTNSTPWDDSESCVLRGLRGMAANCGGGIVPTYGDEGLGAFNRPAQNSMDGGGSNTVFFDGRDMGPANGSGDSANATHFGLPTRNRGVPGAFIFEMDTSPDASGSGDQQGSGGSSIQNIGSSHTSSTTYSPQQQQQQQQQHQVDPMFEPGYTASQLGIRLQGVQQPGGAFITPHDWNDGGGGSTGGSGIATRAEAPPEVFPQASGFGVLSGGELGDVMAGMSDAEWEAVLESMASGGGGGGGGVGGGWDSGLEGGAMNIL